jgi:hypothetical protein
MEPYDSPEEPDFRARARAFLSAAAPRAGGWHAGFLGLPGDIRVDTDIALSKIPG